MTLSTLARPTARTRTKRPCGPRLFTAKISTKDTTSAVARMARVDCVACEKRGTRGARNVTNGSPRLLFRWRPKAPQPMPETEICRLQTPMASSSVTRQFFTARAGESRGARLCPCTACQTCRTSSSGQPPPYPPNLSAACRAKQMTVTNSPLPCLHPESNKALRSDPEKKQRIP